MYFVFGFGTEHQLIFDAKIDRLIQLMKLLSGLQYKGSDVSLPFLTTTPTHSCTHYPTCPVLLLGIAFGVFTARMVTATTIHNDLAASLELVG